MCCDVFYRMLAELKLLPQVNGKQANENYIRQNRVEQWNRIFDFTVINRVLKKNKEFHYTIVSNGVSVSILYRMKKEDLKCLLDDGIIRKRYLEGKFVYELGIDPGMKTWNATVRRTIKTGKEVSVSFVLTLMI